MLESLSETIGNVFNFSLPMVILSVVVVVSLRITYVLKNKIKVVVYQEILALFFIVYILCLFQVVTFQDETFVSSNNIVPFKEIFRYSIGSRLFLKNVLGNVLMFAPYGFFVSYYLKEKKIFNTLILTIIVSISIESIQLLIGRVFDIDDIILNIIGGVLGYLIYKLIQKVGSLAPKVLKSEWFLNIVVIFFFIAFILFL